MKVLIADNHDLVLDSIHRIISEKLQSQMILHATNGIQASEMIKLHKPDLVISDYMMEGMNGLELLIYCKKHSPKTAIMIVSMLREGTLIQTLKQQGVHGYINKECSRDEMVFGIIQVAQGRKYFCSYSTKLMQQMGVHEEGPFITKRELEVLKLIVTEKKNKQIAEELHVDVSTVETHRKNLMRKLRVKSSMGLMRYALENKLFD